MVIRSGRAKTGGKKYAVADGVSEEDKEIIKGALQWNLAGTDKGPSTWRSDWRDATKEYRAFMATKKGKALDNAQLIKTDEFIAMKKAYDLFLENNPDGPKIQQPKRSKRSLEHSEDGPNKKSKLIEMDYDLVGDKGKRLLQLINQANTLELSLKMFTSELKSFKSEMEGTQVKTKTSKVDVSVISDEE